LPFIVAAASLSKSQKHKSETRMTLRPATDSDQPALFDLHRAVFREHIEKIWGWDESWQRANFAVEFACAATSVIEQDGRIVGYVQILDKEDRIHVQNIAISPEYQGKGSGSRILKNLQLQAAARQVPLQLGAFRTNTLAQKLYERLGFRRTGATDTHIEMSWTGHDRQQP
jgi:ribosomal protein S18 acetylase RimI-like enzyme